MTGASERQRNLFPKPADATTGILINDRCLIRTEQDHRIVIVSGIPLAQYAVSDQMAESYAMVSLVEQGWASQKDVARAFGYSTRSLRRYQSRLDNGGLHALGRPRGYPSRRPRV